MNNLQTAVWFQITNNNNYKYKMIEQFYLTIDGTITGSIKLNQSQTGSNSKSYSTFPKAPEQKPHHQMLFNVIPRTLIGGVLLSYWCRRRIQQPRYRRGGTVVLKV